MKSNTEHLLKAINFLAWVVCIGLLLKAGVMIGSFILSATGTSVTAKETGLDLSAYKEDGFIHYFLIVNYKIFIIIIQAYIAFLLTRLLSNSNISQPFNTVVVGLMEKISYAILGVWLITMIHNLHLGLLEQKIGMGTSEISGEFIILSGIVYAIAQMFKRGVEIQNENKLLTHSKGILK